MKICVLGSGSKGNATYFATDKMKCLIDLGTTSLYTVRKLREINIRPEEIDCIFITHTHVDHISGLRVFLRKYHPTVYLTQKMYDELSKEMVISNYVILTEKLYLNDLMVDTIKTSHDASDSVGYIMESNNTSLVYITDTGYINTKYYEKLKNKQVYILESNHDIKMLMDGNYPYYLKQRILGDYGHLSNNACSEYLDTFLGQKTKFVFLAHLSEHNNDPGIAYDKALETILKHNADSDCLIVTKQNERTDVVEV